jgi:hypothetical protein
MNRRGFNTTALATCWAGAAAIGLGCGQASAQAEPAPANAGRLISWPTVRLLDGTLWGPGQRQGRSVVVVWWSVHCGFCVRHNERMALLQSRIERAPLTLLTAARERDDAAVRAHLERHRWALPVTLDSEALASAMGITRRISPLTATVDRAGRLQQVIPGEMSEDDVLGLLEWARRPTGG